MPNTTPKIIANEKPFNISPPKIKIESNASIVVAEVIIVLERVSLMDKFVNSKIFILRCFFIFSHTLSKITTVSFIE